MSKLKLGAILVALAVLLGCGQPEDRDVRGEKETPAAQAKAASATASKGAERSQRIQTGVQTMPTAEPEPRVTLTTQTTLRELAAELTRQLGIEYAADDDVAQTTIAVDFKNATRAEVETVVKEKTKVRLIYSDREVPEQWVHFAGEPY
ncbi:MAG: hypothetical protein N2Z21_02190 [Candidatus Sumerlaeaceae bacterium]|nr:hypothetical protein [Candidatus Sumerlaeaceae bacterium]